MQRSVVIEFRKRISTLKNASADDVSGRLAALLTWLEQEPVTRTALTNLRTSVDENKIFAKTRDEISRPAAYTTEDVAFVGLAMMENCKDQNADFLNLCIAVGIDPGNVELMLRQGLHDYVHPFLEYVAAAVDAAGDQTSVEGVLEMRMTEILTVDFKMVAPKTFAALSELAKEFNSTQETTTWQNIGNSCRHILQAFVPELCLTQGIAVPADVQSGNFKEIGKRLVRDADSRGTLSKLIQAIWDHAQTVTHRPQTTKDEALRVFVWTCLCVSEVAHTAKTS